jgi:hypothetical protein
MKKLTLIFITLIASVSLALTPTERTVLEHARTKLVESQKLFESVNLKLTTAEQQIASANQHAAESDARAASAEQNASQARVQAQITGAVADVLRKQIDVSHDNEQRLANEVAIYKPVYDQVNKWCGIGAFVYGFKKLLHCLMWFGIGAGVLAIILAVVAVWTGAPILAPIAKFTVSIPGRLRRLFQALIPKSKPKSE